MFLKKRPVVIQIAQYIICVLEVLWNDFEEKKTNILCRILKKDKYNETR